VEAVRAPGVQSWQSHDASSDRSATMKMPKPRELAKITSERMARAALGAQGSPARARGVARFFRGLGQYGEGDRFLGVTVPQTRSSEVTWSHGTRYAPPCRPVPVGCRDPGPSQLSRSAALTGVPLDGPGPSEERLSQRLDGVQVFGRARHDVGAVVIGFSCCHSRGSCLWSLKSAHRSS
jgi:hypothetical protein